MLGMEVFKWKRPGYKAIMIAALVLFVIILSIAAYVWIGHQQRQSAEPSGGAIWHETRLASDYKSVNDWKRDQEIEQSVIVSNESAAAQGGQEIYARIQLKEYMEISDLLYVETEERYMTDSSTGHFLTYDTSQQAKDAWGARDYKLLEDKITGDAGWMVPTQAKDPNGQYGTPVVIDIKPTDAASVIPGAVKGQECDYDIHSWAINNNIAQYVTWNLGDAYEFLSQWAPNGGISPHVGPFWLIDDTNDDGWVYWMSPIPPDGETADFMKSVKLIRQPKGPFYYAIHTDVWSVSYEELEDGVWEDMPLEVERLLLG